MFMASFLFYSARSLAQALMATRVVVALGSSAPAHRPAEASLHSNCMEKAEDFEAEAARPAGRGGEAEEVHGGVDEDRAVANAGSIDVGGSRTAGKRP